MLLPLSLTKRAKRVLSNFSIFLTKKLEYRNNKLPSNRSTMKEVLKILQQCSPQEGHGRKKKDHEVAPPLRNDTYLATYKL